MRRVWTMLLLVTFTAMWLAPSGIASASIACTKAVKDANKGKCPDGLVFFQSAKAAPQTSGSPRRIDTAAFKVAVKWNLIWSYDCSKAKANFVVHVRDEGPDDTGLDLDSPFVNELGVSGNGVKRYHSGGAKKSLEVVSNCGWTVTVAKG